MALTQNISVVTSTYLDSKTGKEKGRRTRVGKLITKDDGKQFIAMEDWIKNYLRLPLGGKFEGMINVAPPEDENMTESVSSEENEAVF